MNLAHTNYKIIAEQGTRGAARVDNQLDHCFCLPLELLLFGWTVIAAL